MLKKYFVDERLALLLCIHSNKLVNNKEEISLEEINEICKNVHLIRPKIGISLYGKVVLEWAAVYKMQVEDDVVNYSNFEEYGLIEKSLVYDMELIDCFIEAAKNIKSKALKL